MCAFNYLFRINCGYLLKLPMKKYVFVLIFIWLSLTISAQEITMIISFSPIPAFIFYLCIIFIFTVSIEKSMASDFAPDSTLFLPYWCYLYRLYNICVITVYRCNIFCFFFLFLVKICKKFASRGVLILLKKNLVYKEKCGKVEK